MYDDMCPALSGLFKTYTHTYRHITQEVSTAWENINILPRKENFQGNITIY